MKNKTTIEIDLDVYKAIIQHSNYIGEPANDVLQRLFDVLRKLLKLNNGVAPVRPNGNMAQTGGLMVKGVYLKNGLKLRKHYKGSLLEAEVHDGFIEFNNKKYTSPSGAAGDAADAAVNGWIFWDFFDDNDDKWKLLKTLRSK